MAGIGPGALLAGRYRLQEQVGADEVTATWRAEDVTLQRPMAVRVLSATHARVQTTLDAARRAALVDDARLQRVHGVGVEAGSGYVVLEWVTGQDVVALAGQVSETEALRVVVEAAEALRTAAGRQLHHGRLGPRQVLRAGDGRVRVVGTGIDVAAAGQATPAAAARPESRDVRDLAAVLYALLTGSWPFGATEGLPAAPTEKGRPVGPRSVRAEVGAPLDALLVEVLGGSGPETLDGLVRRLSDLRDGGTRGALVGTSSAAASAPGDDAPGPATQPHDTDELVPVRPSTATGVAVGPVAGAAAGAVAAGAVAAGPAVGGAGAAGGAPPGRTRETPTPSGGSRAVGRSGGGYATAGYATGAYAAEEDDGWDLLPVGDPQWEDAGWDAAETWGDDRQPWDDGWDESQDASADPSRSGGPWAAASVLPASGSTRHGRRRPAGAGTGVAVVLVMAAFVVGGLVLALDRFRDPAQVAAPEPTAVSQSVQPSPAPVAPSVAPSVAPPPVDEPRVVVPAGVQALDPQGDGEENDQEAPRAIDGDPGSSWQTQRYNSQAFGGLKTGLGLAFDLGAPAEVLSVQVTAPGSGGSYEIRSAPGPGYDGSQLIATGVPGEAPTVVTPEAPVTTQFVVVWFTALPEIDGDWRGAVSEVQVQVR